MAGVQAGQSEPAMTDEGLPVVSNVRIALAQAHRPADPIICTVHWRAEHQLARPFEPRVGRL